MKGYESDSFGKVIISGLRHFSENRRDKPELLECHNLCPAEKGLKLHKLISSINSGSWGDTSPIVVVNPTPSYVDI